jgi:hypothetical protein
MGRWKIYLYGTNKKRLDETDKFFTLELNPWEYGSKQNFISTFLAKLY